MSLLLSAVTKFIAGFILVGALLFLPAWSFAYMNGWLFLALLFIPMFILGVLLYFRSPDLLKKRLNAREENDTQKGVVAIAGLLFVCGFIVAGLDFRFGWSHVPTWMVIAASVILLISYALYAEVMRENAFLSRKIEIQEGQKIVTTGVYGIVRHPMYAATIWLFLSIPLVLGSWWSLLCFLPYIPVIVIRIINEEKLLKSELEGYNEYTRKVKYRLSPFIW